MYLLTKNKSTPLLKCVSNFLSDDEINHIFEFSKDIEFVHGKVGTRIENSKNKNDLNKHIKDTSNGFVSRVRENNVKWIELNDTTNWLYDKLITTINEINASDYFYILRHLEMLQFTFYDSNKNGFYRKHTDQSPKHSVESFVSIRKLSFSIQLSDPNQYTGGDLILTNNKISIHTNKEEYIKVPKTKGTLIFFPSDVVHEVTPVTKGDRYSLVGWVSGPNLL